MKLALVLLLLTGCAQSFPPPADTGRINKQLCAQYRMEVAYDMQRARHIAQQRKLYCDDEL